MSSTRLTITVIQTSAQPTRHSAAQRLPLRRWAALFAVFFGLLGQAFHTHALQSEAELTSKNSHALIASQSSDLCPLCIAAHTAVTSPTVEAVALPTDAAAVAFSTAETFHSVRPAFLHFSRPPPAFLL